MTESPVKARKRRALALLVVAFLFVAAAYSVVTPMWEAPDEPSHVDYVAQLRLSRSLPNQRTDAVETSHHPPLYYLMAAIVSLPADLSDQRSAFRPNPRFTWAAGAGDEVNIHLHGSAETFPYTGRALAVHLMRLLSVALAAGTVALTAMIGDTLFPDAPRIGLLAAVLVAFNPQFLFISSGVLNDNLLNMAAAGTVLFSLRAVPLRGDPRRWTRAWMVTGMWAAAATLAKINGVAFLGVAGLALAAASARARSWRLFARGVLGLAVPFLAFAAWWFVRNQMLYGEPLGDTAWTARYPESMRAAPPELIGLVREQFVTFWARFGWMNIGLPEWYYLLVGVVCALAGLGLIIFMARGGRPSGPSRMQVAGVLFCVGCFALQELLLLRENLRWMTASQGRYLFAAIAPLAVAMSVGLNAWLTARAARVVLPVAAITGMCAALAILFGVIRPSYAMRGLPRMALLGAPNRLDVDFGGQFGLRSYEVVSGPQLDTLTVRLLWEAVAQPRQDFSSFVHVVPWAAGPDGPALAQEDQAPGTRADYAPTRWLPGDVVFDERVIRFAGGLPKGALGLRIGVYDAATGVRLPISAGDAARPDSVFLPIQQPVR